MKCFSWTAYFYQTCFISPPVCPVTVLETPLQPEWLLHSHRWLTSLCWSKSASAELSGSFLLPELIQRVLQYFRKPDWKRRIRQSVRSSNELKEPEKDSVRSCFWSFYCKMPEVCQILHLNLWFQPDVCWDFGAERRRGQFGSLCLPTGCGVNKTITTNCRIKSELFPNI